VTNISTRGKTAHQGTFYPGEIKTKSAGVDTNSSVFDAESYGLNGFPLEFAELTDRVSKEVAPGLTPLEAVAELFMKAFQFIKKILDVTRVHVEFWHRVNALILSEIR
jgi:hypothetical protein